MTNTDTKLTQEKAEEIRAKHAAGATRPQLAKEYGVSNTQIRRIVRNQNWVANP